MKALLSLGMLLCCAQAQLVLAGSATWSADPRTKDWNTSGNWTPATVPNGAQDTATFGTTNKTGIALSSDVALKGMVFNPGASVYTISLAVSLTISGNGVTNSSGATQNMSCNVNQFTDSYGYLSFTNNASAGEAMNYDVKGGPLCDFIGAQLRFYDNSSAGSGSVFTSHGGEKGGASGSSVIFYDSSTAANVAFICDTGAVGAAKGEIAFGGKSLTNSTVVVNGGTAAGGAAGLFSSSSSQALVNVTVTTNGGVAAAQNDFSVATSYLSGPGAQGCTFTSNGGTAASGSGGYTSFDDTFDTGDSVLIANGGSNGGNGGLLALADSSVVGGRVELFGNGTLDISSHDAPGAAVGSIEGDGVINLGGLNLTVGSSSLSTTFAGTVEGTAGSSLTKTGTGTLTFNGSATFAGGTTVAAGTLGGNGTIAGALTIGVGNGAGATVAPAAGGPLPMTLTTEGALTFNADGTYTCTLSTKRQQADQVAALGATIDRVAQFQLRTLAKKRLTAGQTFVVLNNTSGLPIGGTFANLADGSTLKSGNNKFQVSYEGGDGNDLTLTVVP